MVFVSANAIPLPAVVIDAPDRTFTVRPFC